VVKVREPNAQEVDLIPEGASLIAFLRPYANADLIEKLKARRIAAFAMEKIPRTTRAQRMDALSSMATVAGYRAMLLAAASLGRFFPLLMTAAGTIAPARVFILGAGVAGLQAIATARRLGAVVEAFDVRPAVREEVQSLGATFIAADHVDEKLVAAGGYAQAMSEEQEKRERELIHKHVQGADVVVTTANVPGRRAPMLVTEAMVKDMKPGSVIVDLAAESGGNCEVTKAGETCVVHGVHVLAPLNLAASLPFHASQMYARNVSALLQLMVKDGAMNLDFTDDILRDTCVTRAESAAPVPAGGAS
jgi:NAD(P) transhydrogenase subunit alpha